MSRAPSTAGVGRMIPPPPLALLQAWFQDFAYRKKADVINPALWSEQTQELHVIALKYLGDQCNPRSLLELIHHSHLPVRWWASYHLAHVDMKFRLGEVRVSEYGDGGKRQVLEVIVRQALAGAPWRVICAGPLAVNALEHCDIFKEMVRRGHKLDFGLDLKHLDVPEATENCLSNDEHAEMWLQIYRTASAYLSSNASGNEVGAPDLTRIFKLSVDSLANLKLPAGIDQGSLVQKWMGNLLSTATDRSSAERALLEWYRILRQPFPSRIVWCESPVDALIAATEKLDQVNVEDASMSRLLAMSAFWMESPGISMPIGHSASLNNPLLLSQWQRLRPAAPPFRNVVSFHRSGLRERLFETLIGEARANNPHMQKHSFSRLEQVLRSGFAGQFESDWLSLIESRMPAGEEISFWKPLVDLVHNCGFWWAFEDCIIATDKPTSIHLDDGWRFHNTSAPALEFGNNFKLFRIRGVPVPPVVVYAPETLTVEMIDSESNIEVRRIMIERFGAQRFILEAGAQVIDHCGQHVLYRREVTDDEPVVMVKVINSTAEPDGSFKEYFLRVPPDTTSVKAAIAWTFDMDEATYSPTVET